MRLPSAPTFSLLIPVTLATLLMPLSGAAGELQPQLATTNWVGPTVLAIFFAAYALVVTEEITHLRKSKPVMLAAGLIWALIGWQAATKGLGDVAEKAVRANLLEYAELMLFLIVAMTYINAMEERQVFEALRSWLIARRFSLRQLFWVTGLLAFFISSMADNLTTALLMAAVVMAVGPGHPGFIAISCVNLVVAANAGGGIKLWLEATATLDPIRTLLTREGRGRGGDAAPRRARVLRNPLGLRHGGPGRLLARAAGAADASDDPARRRHPLRADLVG